MSIYAISFVAVVVSLLLHDLGHALAAKILNLRVNRFGLSWIGRYVVRDSGLPTENIVIAAMGPLVSLILWSVGLLLGWHLLATFNLWFGLVSLLPFRGMDGFRILSETARMVASLTTWGDHPERNHIG